MTTPSNGGPAFPLPANLYEHSEISAFGLSKRELFAAMAMQAMLRNVTHPDGFVVQAVKEERAARACEEADALLAELARTEGGGG